MDAFKDKVVIVTGAASGIGRALVEALVRREAIVILTDINRQLLDEVAASLAASGYRSEAAPVDVSDHDAVSKLVTDTVDRHGRIDYLFNNAGIEGADLGVKVSVVCPGYIKTAIFHTSKLIKIDREKMLASLPERLGITPEECAAAIIRGVERNQAIIVVTWFAKVLWALHRISPALIRWMMGRDLRKTRREMRIGD